MVKESQISMVRQIAIVAELEKIAFVGIAARLLTKVLPKLLLSSAKALGKGKAMTSSAGHKFLSRAGKKGLGLKDTYKRGVSLLSKSYGPKGATDYSKLNFKGMGSSTGPTARPWFGKTRGSIGVSTETSRFPKFTENAAAWLKTRPKAWTGEMAHNLDLISKRGLVNFAKHEIGQGRTFIRKGHIFKKSPIGQVAGAVATTGIGFGAIDFAAGGQDALGRKVGLARRSARALTTAAGWSVAPGFSMGKLTAEIAPSVPGGIAEATKGIKRKFFTNNRRDFDFAQ